MTARILMLAYCFGFISQANASTEIHFDAGFAEAVLEDVCSDKTINRDALLKSEVVVDMVSHFAQFRDYFTLEAYVDARQLAAKCEKTERDIFRFNEVIDRRVALSEEVSELKASSGAISSAISDMLAPYTPSDLQYNGRATIMIGTPSCGGWSKGPDFYLDLPCISGDATGLQYLIAHESYHGTQERFMPRPQDGDLMQKLLSEILREGSATAIADFSEIEGGPYTKLSQDTLSKNERRMDDNFALMDLAVGYLKAHPNKDSYSFINNIGLSGQFDAPFYSVGATIFNALEMHDGREALMCLLSQVPSHVFARYHQLKENKVVADEWPSLGPDLASVIGTRVLPAEYQECLSN